MKDCGMKGTYKVMGGKLISMIFDDEKGLRMMKFSQSKKIAFVSSPKHIPSQMRLRSDDNVALRQYSKARSAEMSEEDSNISVEDEIGEKTREIESLIFGSLSFISFLFFFVVLGLSYKAMKFIKFQNYSIMAMLICLSLTVLFRSISFAVKAFDVVDSDVINPDVGKKDKPLTLMSALPVLFL